MIGDQDEMDRMRLLDRMRQMEQQEYYDRGIDGAGVYNDFDGNISEAYKFYGWNDALRDPNNITAKERRNLNALPRGLDRGKFGRYIKADNAFDEYRGDMQKECRDKKKKLLDKKDFLQQVRYGADLEDIEYCVPKTKRKPKKAVAKKAVAKKAAKNKVAKNKKAKKKYVEGEACAIPKKAALEAACKIQGKGGAMCPKRKGVRTINGEQYVVRGCVPKGMKRAPKGCRIFNGKIYCKKGVAAKRKAKGKGLYDYYGMGLYDYYGAGDKELSESDYENGDYM